MNTFQPKHELGEFVYILDLEDRKIIKGQIISAAYEKRPYYDEYENPKFERDFDYAKPFFSESYEIKILIDGNSSKTIKRYESGVYSTPEEAAELLSKYILAKDCKITTRNG